MPPPPMLPRRLNYMESFRRPPVQKSSDPNAKKFLTTVPNPDICINMNQ